MFPTLFCLHGWGGSKESFTELKAALQAVDVRVIAVDLPGFGEEPSPERPWTIDDYAAWAEQEIMKRGIDGPVHLLGHSHGGRISLKMAVRGNVPIAHLYLCASAGIRHARHVRRWIGWMLARAGSAFTSIPGLRSLKRIGRTLLYKLMRVHDYERANPVMQKTMILVSQEDLRPILEKIHVPTDIFWGTDDRQTPLSDGELMHARIKGSHLHVYPGIRHGVHRDAADAIAHVIERTLAGR